MKKTLQNILRYLLFVSTETLWIALVAILPDFYDNPITGFQGVLTIVAYVIAISVVSFLLLYVLSLNKYIAAIFIPIYGMIGAAVSYYRIMYRVTITPLILDCILHTNLEEVMGVTTWSLILWILLNAVIGICFVVWRWRINMLSYKWLQALCAILLFCGYYYFNSRLHQSINQRYPMHIIESMRQHMQLQRQRYFSKHTLPPYVVNRAIDTLDIIVVIGESMRADHLSLNGYSRMTNPLLIQRDNLVSLPNIYTEQTHTLASVPILLTRADSLNPDLQFSETSFAAILRKEGYHTAWISNQDLGETFAAFPSECDTTIWVNAGKSVFVFSGWYDEELLPYMDEQLALGYSRNLLILHTIGSHWYYNNHVPNTHYYFNPITDNRVVTSNLPEAVINSYDNTVLYLDFVLDSMIKRLENRNAILIYLSDHGESLGEGGDWLHAAGANSTKNPACIIWYSDKFAKCFPEKVNALQENQSKRFRTDFLFHSVLDVAEITTVTNTVQATQDIFRTQ